MEPEIIEEDDHYKVIIPKNYATRKNVEIFLANIVKSKDNNSLEDPLKKSIEALTQRWPDEEIVSPKSYSELSVLVVDDQSSVRKVMKNSLKDLEFQVQNIEEVGDGAAAIGKLQIRKFDIILSDWNMPGINGLDLLKIIKSVPGLKNMYFIMVTTRGNQKCVMDAIEGGIDGYIIKPFTTAQVEKILKKTIPSK